MLINVGNRIIISQGNVKILSTLYSVLTRGLEVKGHKVKSHVIQGQRSRSKVKVTMSKTCF